MPQHHAGTCKGHAFQAQTVRLKHKSAQQTGEDGFADVNGNDHRGAPRAVAADEIGQPRVAAAMAAHVVVEHGADADGTVFISDPETRLDVGAVAKGWSAQRAAENAPEGLLISVGGNVCVTGPKTEKGDPWVVGIQNPDGGDYLHTVCVIGGSVVTSGDYQRTYLVDGEYYHHIIDPETLMPSRYWRSVTVVCADSGIADALSTALFLLPQDEGQSLLTRYNAEAMWLDADGGEFFSPGFQALLRT